VVLIQWWPLLSLSMAALLLLLLQVWAEQGAAC
jgi:hypothetical protein